MSKDPASSAKIRLAKPGEIDRIVDLVRPMWVMHGLKEPNVLDAKYPEKLDAKAYFAPCFSHPDTNRLYVAVEGDRIVGCCRAEIIELEGMYNERKGIYIDDLVVDRDFRRRGIATKLLDEVDSFARSQKIRLLKARVYRFNAEAQALHRKRGFDPTYSEHYKLLKD